MRPRSASSSPSLTGPVVCVLGEGSAQYAITGFWTAAAYDVPVTFLVLRNEEYSILKWFADVEEVKGAPGLDLPALEVAKVAEAYGVSSQAVSGRDELHAALEGAIGSGGPSWSRCRSPRAWRCSSSVPGIRPARFVASASDYAIKNFEDIEPSGADGVDGRFSRKFLDSTELGVSRWRYEPGRQVAGHRHEVQEEVYTASMVGSHEAGRRDRRDQAVGRDWRRARRSRVASRAGPDGLEIIAAGGSKPEGGDGELVEGHWPGD